MKIIFPTEKKNDKDIDDFYFRCFILAKVCVSGWGKRQTAKRFLFFSSFVKIRERRRDIKLHSNNKFIMVQFPIRIEIRVLQQILKI